MTPPGFSGVPIRSAHGCWTCRLRKKKCDEQQPSCARCTSVDVECHYGQRPEWITNPIRKKEELDRIKVKVSASAKRKRAAFRARSQAAPERPVQKWTFPHVDSEDVNNNTIFLPPSPNTVQNPSPSNGATPKSIHEAHANDNLPALVSDGNETNLMMHYLDHVFFIQFRFYTPSVSSGGRGWLLSLLRHTKPLYHAALSISAFHQQSLLSNIEKNPETEHGYLRELDRHHTLTLEELQLFILTHQEVDRSASGNSGRNVQILACMVELISFEVCITFEFSDCQLTVA